MFFDIFWIFFWAGRTRIQYIQATDLLYEYKMNIYFNRHAWQANLHPKCQLWNFSLFLSYIEQYHKLTNEQSESESIKRHLFSQVLLLQKEYQYSVDKDIDSNLPLGLLEQNYRISSW